MTTKKQDNKKQKQEQATGQNMPARSEIFVGKVQKQFATEMGSAVQFTEYEKTLAQHLFLKIDEVLKKSEADRIDKNKKFAEYRWDNVDLNKLALDAVHIVHLGLDALIPNHLHPMPYWSSAKKKYDIDLAIGFKGLDYYMQEMAVEKPKLITYKLVYSNERFKPVFKDVNNPVESYIHEPAENPFEEAEVIGGYGYIEYEDSTKNQLIRVKKSDLDKAKSKAKTHAIWDEWPERMQYKTIVRRVTSHLKLDPKKINKSVEYLEQREIEALETQTQQQISDNANTIDIDNETPEHNQETGEVQEPENEDVPDQEWDINEGGELFDTPADRPAKSNINEEV